MKRGSVMKYTKYVYFKPDGNPVKCGVCTDECINTELLSGMSIADNLIFLTVLYGAWKENSLRLRAFRFSGLKEYHLGVMYILNYLNSLYAIKEFLDNILSGKRNKKDHNSESVYSHFEGRYRDVTSWLRFGIEYRNKVIHKGDFLKRYAIDDFRQGEFYICLEDFAELQRKYMKCVEDRDAFVSNIESLFDVSVYIDNRHYFPLLEAVRNIDSELIEELGYVFKYVFEKDMKSVIDTLLSLCLDVSSYRDTYYSSDVGDAVYPNVEIEGYLINSVINTGLHSPLSELILVHLIEKGYCYLFTQRKTIVEFVDQMSMLTVEN